MSKRKRKIAFILPCYNESKNLIFFNKKLNNHLIKHKAKYDFKLIYINDGSSDNTWELIKRIKRTFENVNGIKLFKNYEKIGTYKWY